MDFDLLLRGGTLATPFGTRWTNGDVGILGGKIAAIGALGDAKAVETVDVSGLLVMPGAIDTQVHFREPGLEHKEDLESGTRSALMGGVTSILEMPNTQPNTTTPEALEDKLRRADGRAWCHYGFFMGAAVDNLTRLGEFEQLPGTPGIKIFMGSSTGTLLVSEDDDLRVALRHGRKRIPIHAEDEPRNRARKSLLSADPHPREHPFLRDAESARIATERILALSAETGRPVHVLHISTADELPLLADAKMRGLKTTCEATPQHLWFAAPDCYERLGTFAQMNPPVRSAEHRDAIRKAVADGLFDVFGSDHAPHTREEKAQSYPASPSGMPGVQTLLPALLTLARRGMCPVEQVVAMLTEGPAALYGIEGKGALREGADADLALVDLDATWTFEEAHVESKCGWSPFTGETFVGRVEHVVLGGAWAVRDRARVARPAGRMLRFAG